MMPRYIVFEDKGRLTPQHKTRQWDVKNKRTDALLGQIYWHKGWRCYVFQPEDCTIYEQECMRDIALFLERATADYKQKKAA